MDADEEVKKRVRLGGKTAADFRLTAESQRGQAPGGTGFLFSMLLLVTMAMMALSFLSFAATNQFQIAHHGIGPTEIRIGYIALNTFVFFVGNGVFWWGLPVVLGLNIVVLAGLAWRTQRDLWYIDKAALAEKQ